MKNSITIPNWNNFIYTTLPSQLNHLATLMTVSKLTVTINNTDNNNKTSIFQTDATWVPPTTKDHQHQNDGGTVKVF